MTEERTGAPAKESDYQTVVVPEILGDGSLVYVANHPELRGCRAQAETPELAREYLSEVFQRYVEHFTEHHLDLPKPRNKGIREVVWRSAPGARPLMASAPVIETVPTMGITQPPSHHAQELSGSKR